MTRLLLFLILALSAHGQIPAPILSSSTSSASPVASALARTLNGSSDYLASAATIDLSSTKVLSIWIRANHAAFNTSDGLLLETSVNSNSNVGAFYVDPNAASGKFVVSLKTAAGNPQLAFDRPSTGNADYLIVIDNRNVGSAGATAAYINGAAATNQVITNAGSFDNTALGNYSLYVGARAGSSLFDALTFSDLWMWKADETANKTSLHSCSTSPGTVDTANIVAGWPIKQVSPETPGTNGGAINLTPNGTTNAVSACP